MKTYSSWSEILVDLNTNKVECLCFELDRLFNWPVRYKISKEESISFVCAAIKNETPFPDPYKLDFADNVYFKNIPYTWKPVK